MPDASAHMPRAPKRARGYIDPYLGGVLLGIVLFLAFYITGNGLGASAAINRTQVAILKAFDAAHVDRIGYMSEMGGGQRNPLNHPSIYMLLGTILGGFLSGLFNRRLKFETRRGPRISLPVRLGAAFLGGTIMAYGARLARGCTSGQALSGGAVLSVGSFALMFSIFISAYALAYSLRRLWT
jgi:uncharacterized membrane protein YedE/YeeE